MKPIFGILGVAAALTTASPARADHAEELAAQTLYDKALELMKAGKAASACPLLTESQRLDPASGTQYRLAECLEKTGRTEAAWRLYTEVAEASKKAGRKERETQAREHAEAVWKLLPRLTILVPLEFAKMDEFAIKRDGVTVPPGEWNVEVLVVPGEHIVTAQATGKKAWRGTMTARSGATEQVWVPSLEVVPAIEPLAPKVEIPADTGAAPASPDGLRKAITIAGITVGAVAAVGGAGFGIAWGVENAGQTTCSHSCTHLKNLMFWNLVGAAVVGGATLTYTLATPKPKQIGVSRATIWVRDSALGASFVRSW